MVAEYFNRLSEMFLSPTMRLKSVSLRNSGYLFRRFFSVATFMFYAAKAVPRFGLRTIIYVYKTIFDAKKF